MTAPRLSAYQAFIIAAGELFSVLTAAAASPPPPERFMAAVSDAVATIDRAHSSLLLVASQDALTWLRQLSGVSGLRMRRLCRSAGCD